MSIDLSQFYEVFFEESFEGLDVMESELLELKPGDVDLETINTIFRAAHSIKGGSGTFGFAAVSDFTHVVETLLDQIRDGRRALTDEHVELLLQSVDCLRSILSALQSSEEPDTQLSSELKQKFEHILDGDNETSTEEESESVSSNSEATTDSNGWKIVFKPGVDIFKTGNEPVFMFQELAELGALTLVANCDEVQPIEHMDPEECHLSWEIELKGDITEDAINEVFEWVADESDIEIVPLGAGGGREEEVLEGELQSASEEVFEDNAQIIEPEGKATVAESGADKVVRKPAAQEQGSGRNVESASIRVSIDKVDSLINMVGELVITQAMLTQLGEGEFDPNKLESLKEGLQQLSHNTRDLQESVMRIRMLPISFVFSRFPRVVRDVSQKLGKKVELKLLGEQTELDKTVMEKIVDPMTHLIRNSLDHGLEMPEDRIALGKPETGTVTLNAFHQGGNIIIEIIDDGAGLNREKIRNKALEQGLISENDELTPEEINDLIFRPGFSTATEVSDLSGRGVGMDVVRRNIEGLNGSVEVQSEPGVGSTFTIRLPLTLAILDGQLVRVGDHTYIIPLISIIESLQVSIDKVNVVGGETQVLRLRDEYIPIICLWDLFNHRPSSKKLEEGLLVVVEADNEKVGVLVDDLLAQQQVVIKSLEANYQKIEGVSGATILGDGTVSLIVDISGLIKLAGLKRPGHKGLNIQHRETVS